MLCRPSRPFLLLGCSLLLVSLPAWSFSTTSLLSSTKSPQSRLNTRLFSSSDDNRHEEGTGSVLIDDYGSSGDSDILLDASKVEAKFGESVSLKRPTSGTNFGESVPLKKPSSSDSGDLFSSVAADTEKQSKGELEKMRERNIVVALISVFLAISSYLWQFTHPITPVQLLASMQSNSAPLTSIGNNGRPTVVDFWAPWCENCKLSAPTLQKLEEEYKDQVNFVMVNGDRPEAFPLIERFGVDAIPHLALISAEGDVETALIGPIPKRVLEADLNVLISNANTPDQDTNRKELPFQMMDAFSKRPELRRVHFEDSNTKKVE